MNSNIPLPAMTSANWIWNNSQNDKPEEFILFRREFACDTMGVEGTLLLASPCCCRVFINGYSVGFGPSAHPDHNKVYASCFDISDFIECGNNTVSILAWHDPENTTTPAIWCEIDIRNQQRNRAAIRLGSDADWDSAPGSLWPGLVPQRRRFPALHRNDPRHLDDPRKIRRRPLLENS